MTLRALLLRCLLALALVATGLPAVAGAHAHADAQAVASSPADAPPCHDTGDAPPPPPDGPDCCDGEGPACGCDCLHATPGVAATVAPPAGVPPSGLVQLPVPPASPLGGPLPSLRPPIA